MMDLSLGGPVEAPDNPNKKHSGPCNDSTYGCIPCWNRANDGKGTIATCEWCNTPDVPTRITKASDEPAYYAVCAACRERQQIRLAEELRELQDWADQRPDARECDDE